MRQRFRTFIEQICTRALRWLNPPVDQTSQLRNENRWLNHKLDDVSARNQAMDRMNNAEALERISELVEARAMAGSGPWRVPAGVVADTDRMIGAALESLRSGSNSLDLQESVPAGAVGAFSDINLALQNVGWQRQVNMSWLEFSRWGIQQIIMISRLNYVKNPTIQRGINVTAQYVFGRGVEVSSPDADANDVLKTFFERNKRTLGQIALADLERRKMYDGNLFFALFSDKINTGEVNVRMIDALEIQEIVTDPDDSDSPQYYQRVWTQRIFDPKTGSTSTKSQYAWYPALGYYPAEKPKQINGHPVMWETPVLHRKCGAVSKWLFGCPLVYAALDWAKASKRFLEACATVKQALAQVAMTITTKGGPAALEGVKAQLSTTVGPASALWDQNPSAVNGSTFASGPGTSLQAFKTTGAGGDPEEVRRFELMVWRVFGIPETFGGDVSTGNLATAQSLDRPTELNFLEKQEAWRDDLVTIAKYVLQVNMGATSGTLREAVNRRKVPANAVVIAEARRVSKRGETVRYEAAAPNPVRVEVMVTFPSILEGDIPNEVGAVVQAMTLGTGSIAGIDERAGVRKLYTLLDIDGGDDLVDQQYPDTGPDLYDPVRRKPDEPVEPAVPVAKQTTQEARRLIEAAKRFSERLQS